MQFVAYHKCGAAREPRIDRCQRHNAVAVRLPGTESARELYFYCPECKDRVSQGFPFTRCDCEFDKDKPWMSINVHRSSLVYSPQYTVVVNPPDPAVAARLRSTGGGARALDWVLDGMTGTDPTEGKQTLAGFIDMLRQNGVSEETAHDLARQAAERGEVVDGQPEDPDLPEQTRTRAQEEALGLASAVTAGRIRIADMVDGTTPPLRSLYEGPYPAAISLAGLSGVELLTNFPVASLAYGYTRDGGDPGQSRLVPFRERGRPRVYASLARTEALLFRLDPQAVYRQLRARGAALDAASDDRQARLAILRQIDIPTPGQDGAQQLGGDLITLLHSYAHRTIRRLAVFAGVERDALAEYLIPHHFAFIVYAAARGNFVLGGLQACFETSLGRVLREIVKAESRCPLDPGCGSGGGACMACLHLGEPSCRWYNRFLDRSTLFGSTGYFEETTHRG
jgi:hypothetical protein